MARKKMTSRKPAKIARIGRTLPKGYAALLADIKVRIRAAQVKAALAVNRELIVLYWDIGKAIVERQQAEGWGKAVVGRLARDLQRAFPAATGYSPQNLWHMRSFYLAWTQQVANLQQAVGDLDAVSLPQPVAEIPWGHNLKLLSKLKAPLVRLWYAEQTIANGIINHSPVSREFSGWQDSIAFLCDRLLGSHGPGADFDGSLADEARDDFAAVVVFDQHIFFALRIGALDGEDHGYSTSAVAEFARIRALPRTTRILANSATAESSFDLTAQEPF